MNERPTLYLVDRDAPFIAAWQQAFACYDNVEVIQDDFFSVEADLMVSPANSFGIMDGGLDLVIREKLGAKIETKLQAEIVAKFYGELPVGHCHIIETDNSQWPLLASAPTMRVPALITGTLNVYYAFRAVLLAVQQHPQKIHSILCPGLGTGVGGMQPDAAAGQMKFAYSQFLHEPKIPTAREVLSGHQTLMKYQ